MKNKGFTLIELLVVVSIASLLSAIILNSVKNVRGKGRDAGRMANLRELSRALELYFDAKGFYPYPGLGYNKCGNCSAVDFAGDKTVWSYLFYEARGAQPYGGESGGYVEYNDCAADWIPLLANSVYYSGSLPSECSGAGSARYKYASDSKSYMLSVYLDVSENRAKYSIRNIDGACPDDWYQIYTPGAAKPPCPPPTSPFF